MLDRVMHHELFAKFNKMCTTTNCYQLCYGHGLYKYLNKS
jgi:hypothetical protein